MQLFEDMKDVEEWLEPLDYEAFWKEVDPFVLRLPERRSCDADIRAGIVTTDVVLGVLKAMARAQIVLDQRLPPRFYIPEMSLH